MRVVSMFSGGAASWAAAKRLRATVARDDMTLLFADTRMEDEDLYRFIAHASANLDVPVTFVADGRTPWQVFRDKRFIGNSRVDPCSRILKRELLRKWLVDHCDPADSVVVLGYDAEETSRVAGAAGYWAPWAVRSPLCETPMMDKDTVLEWAESEGLKLPRLYALGFKHNNCGGFCIKAGHEQFALLLRTMPSRFKYHEQEEEALRQHLGKDVAILKDRRGGDVKPLTLREFRRRVEAQEELDCFGGTDCSCFSPEVE